MSEPTKSTTNPKAMLVCPTNTKSADDAEKNCQAVVKQSPLPSAYAVIISSEPVPLKPLKVEGPKDEFKLTTSFFEAKRRDRLILGSIVSFSSGLLGMAAGGTFLGLGIKTKNGAYDSYASRISAKQRSGEQIIGGAVALGTGIVLTVVGMALALKANRLSHHLALGTDGISLRF